MNINIDNIISFDEVELSENVINKILDVLKSKHEFIIFKDNKPQFIINSIQKNKSTPELLTKKVMSKVKIGKLVQEKMRFLFFNNMLSNDDISSLCDNDFSKLTFNLNYPVLKKVDVSLDLDTQKKDNKNYSRYYNFTLQHSGDRYLLCSQWIENLHRDKVELWLKSKNVLN